MALPSWAEISALGLAQFSVQPQKPQREQRLSLLGKRVADPWPAVAKVSANINDIVAVAVSCYIFLQPLLLTVCVSW